MKIKDTLDKAYGNIPRETTIIFDLNWVTVRGIKYHWLKFKRYFTR
jgi:hypothetical protein